MSDMIDMYRDLKEYRREQRRLDGVPCPQCAVVRPKAQATILMPGRRCRVDGYRDPRPHTYNDERMRHGE